VGISAWAEIPTVEECAADGGKEQGKTGAATVRRSWGVGEAGAIVGRVAAGGIERPTFAIVGTPSLQGGPATFGSARIPAVSAAVRKYWAQMSGLATIGHKAHGSPRYASRMTMFDLLHQTAIADTDLLRRNDELGDVFTTPREVDFAFDSTERQRAQDFAEFVNGKNYGKATIDEIAGGRFRILVRITMPITQPLICCVSGFMACLSRLFQIDYQGWGSVVQKH
jgi:hypothetical protein